MDEVVEVAAPVGEVWRQWAELEGLPRFMEGIASVRRDGDDHIRWRGAVDGRDVEWTSRISAWEPERRIAWTSESGHRDAGGEVTFAETAPGRTRVHVRIDWPSEDQVEASLERLRRIVEA
ncbi:MAG TPA: SRPBCC family protein [Miltoncostaea sp.]|nr:SRPBCC family protein [Miltoncostaea sp.]